MIPTKKLSPENYKSDALQQALNQKIGTKRITDLISSEYFYDYDCGASDYSIPRSVVSKAEYEALHKSKKQVEQRLIDAELTMARMTEGNETMQRSFIQADPRNIRYIKRPYITIQVEAITADPSCFNLITNPSQEAIDTYRLIK